MVWLFEWFNSGLVLVHTQLNHDPEVLPVRCLVQYLKHCIKDLFIFHMFFIWLYMPTVCLLIYSWHPIASKTFSFSLWNKLMYHKAFITKSGCAGLNWLWSISKDLNLKWWFFLCYQQTIQVFILTIYWFVLHMNANLLPV